MRNPDHLRDYIQCRSSTTPPSTSVAPVKLELTDPIDRLIATNTNVYSGSVQMPCAARVGATWVGPQGQTAATAGAEVYVGPDEGLRETSVIPCDNVLTVPRGGS
jgi:hypothetical protein